MRGSWGWLIRHRKGRAMHKRMRRGKEMYPSFDTRRVLCKQHRPYCVKPMRARLKPSNANAVARPLSANREKDFVALVQAGASGIESETGKKHTGNRLNTKKSAGHTKRLIMTTSAKSKERGMRPITSRRHIYAPVRFATNNMFQEFHLARFVQKNARSRTALTGRERFTVPQLRKGESKSVNTESAMRTRSRLIETSVKSCHTTE